MEELEALKAKAESRGWIGHIDGKWRYRPYQKSIEAMPTGQVIKDITKWLIHTRFITPLGAKLVYVFVPERNAYRVTLLPPTNNK